MRLFGDATRKRRLLLALGVYALVTLVMVLVAAPETLREHTAYNHFALLAEAFLHGRLDLGGPPPAYAGNNDFALYAERHFVVFPPFPALLLLPLVWLEGGAERVADGAFFVVLSGAAPAILFLALEKLRRAEMTARSQTENLLLSLLFAFGSVYFFSAAQGTVWFAAHVVAAALTAAYLLFSIGAERPFAAGLALGLGFATRSPVLFAAPLFLLEAVRSAAPSGASPFGRLGEYLGALDRRRLLVTSLWFSAPLSLIVLLTLAYNALRFDDPFEVGYRYLTVVWQTRIERWGLFSYHYLARNLGVVLTSLPWIPGERGAPFSINHHGLALWVTTPLYLLLFTRAPRAAIRPALIAGALGAALPSLFYQNTGWLQFGYRFSNDYAVFLFALLALGRFSLKRVGGALALTAVLVNTFGALSFGRPEYRRFYFTDPTQRVLYQPD